MDHRILGAAGLALALCSSALAQPWPGEDAKLGGYGYADARGLQERPPAIDPKRRTLVLISAGQSLATNILPTLYLPQHPEAVSNFNIYDGKLYDIRGPLLGTSTHQAIGVGNVMVRVADLLISAGAFDRVILVPVSLGGTFIEMWATGALADRIPRALRQLRDAGITPDAPGVTFTLLWAQGETDVSLNTSAEDYAGHWRTIVARAEAAGFRGRFFMNIETMPDDRYSTVYHGQLAAIDGMTTFAGGDWNAIGIGGRTDGTHFDDIGGEVAAYEVVRAMRVLAVAQR
jgi:hypothetical protein